MAAALVGPQVRYVREFYDRWNVDVKSGRGVTRRKPGTSPDPHADGLLNVGPIAELVSVRLRRVDSLLIPAFSAATIGLKQGVTSALGLIVGNPGISQNDIARLTRTDKSIIVAVVDQLEELGWATRTRSTVDRRRHELHATKLGKTELKRITAKIAEHEQRLLADLSQEDRTALFDILERMHASCRKAVAAAEAADSGAPERAPSNGPGGQ